MEMSLVGAIKRKYEEEEEEEEASQVVVFVTSAPSKEGALAIPSVLTMNGAEITETGDREELREMCGNVTELDLTDNRISEWTQVCGILDCMPKVTFVNLSGNPLGGNSPRASLSHLGGMTFDRVTHLVLNYTQIPWCAVLELLAIFPCLRELHLSLNGMTSLELTDVSPYDTLKQIYLNKNQLSDWSQVCALGAKFPNMEGMVLLGNPLGNPMGDPSNGAKAGDLSCLKCLTTLNISETQIDDWQRLAKLGRAPNLTDLRLKHIPLLKTMEEKKARQMCIVYLPNVTRLNGSLVLEEEKVDAERAFIRRYLNCEHKPQRCLELEEKYGQLDPLAKVDLVPPSHARVTVEFMDSVSERKISLKQTVGQLKKELQSVAGLPSKSFRLYHLEPNVYEEMNELKLLRRNCFSIPIREGDVLKILLK